MRDKPQENELNRREFCQVAAGGVLAAVAAPAVGASAGPNVALVRNSGVWDGESLKTDPKKVRQMLDRAICMALGKDDPIEAWKTIARPTDTVGLKINCLGGRSLTTDHQLIDAVAASLEEAGVAPGNIIIWDRSDSDMKKGGHELQKEMNKARRLGTPGMCEKVYPFGQGHETTLSTLLTDTCDVTINMPVLKSHPLAGYSAALKNHMGDMPKPQSIHGDNCVAVGDLNALEPIRKKTRLVVLDAFRPLWDGGPGDRPSCRWKYNGLLVSTDQVAIDRVAHSIIEEKRQEVKGEPWPVADDHLRRAAELGLGEGDLNKINLMRLG